MAKEKCVICNCDCGWLNSNKLKDKRRLCYDCQRIIKAHNEINKHILVSNIDKVSSDDIRKMYDDPNLSIHDFYRTEKTEADLEFLIQYEKPKEERKAELCMVNESYETVKNEAQKTSNKKCIVCLRVCGWLETTKLKDDTYICDECKEVIKNNNDINRKLSPWLNEIEGDKIRKLYKKPELSLHDFYCTSKTRAYLEGVEEAEEEIYQQKHTREICGVYFNDVTKEISFGKLEVFKELVTSESEMPSKFPYKSLIKYEYKEGENTITQGGSGLGRAIVGGVLFGGVGAVVGAATNKRTQKSYISDMSVYLTFDVAGKRFLKKIKINEFLDNEIKYGSSDYMNYMRKVERLIGVLDEIYFENHKNEIPKSTEKTSVSVSNADEIRKYKQLLDDGIISQKEFDKVKKQLLGV